MHLENLKTFADLVESESFSHAARLNDVTQSAVSQQLRALEKHFGILIIDRGSKQFRLTPEGERMHSSVKKMLRTYEELRCELNEMRDTIIGSVYVSSVCSVGIHELPQYIKRYFKLFPKVDLRIEYRRSDLVYDDVLNNGSDLGLIAYPEDHKELEVIPFLRNKLVLVCHPEHELASSPKVMLSDLENQLFVAFHKGMPTARAINKIFNDANLKITPIKECDNVETLKRTVEINAGFSILPEAAVKYEVAQGLLVSREIHGLDAWRTLAIIRRKDRIITPQAQRFIDVLKGAS